MQGTELLAESREIYPIARRVLLTAYSDINAAIRASTTRTSITTCRSRGILLRSACSR